MGDYCMSFCIYMCSLWFVRLGDIGWVVGVILSVHFGSRFLFVLLNFHIQFVGAFCLVLCSLTNRKFYNIYK